MWTLNQNENAIIVGRKKCASRKQEMKVADRKALCASTVRSLVAAVGSCKSRRFLSDARAVVDDNTFGKKFVIAPERLLNTISTAEEANIP